MRNVLCLATFAVRRDNQPLRHAIGDLRAVVASHDVQAEIEPRRTAGRTHDVAIVDIEHVRIDLHARISA